jgi:trk system potassium uptake protein TrkA
MKVAIAGAGNVGTSIASELHDAGHSVLLIEQDPDLVAQLRPTLDVTWYEGDACEVNTLQAAGLADSDVVVAATGDDEDNLVVSLLAKMEFAVPRVVEEAVSVGTLVRLLQFAQGEARLVEVTLASDSPAKGKPLSDMDLPRDISVVAVVRGGRVVVPRGDTVMQVGDEVLVLVTGDAENTVKELLVGS